MPSISGPASHNDIMANSNALVNGANIDPELLKPADDFDKDTFLQLMVAQLKYQNPLEPMDSAAFMAQTAQFTTVEKLNELTAQIGEQLATQRLGSATGMIGRDVTFANGNGTTVTERVTSVKFNINGPLLITAGGSELGLGQIAQVSAPGTAPAVAAPAPSPDGATEPDTSTSDPDAVDSTDSTTSDPDTTDPVEPTA